MVDLGYSLVERHLEEIRNVWNKVHTATREDDLLCVLLEHEGQIEVTVGSRSEYIEMLKKDGKPAGVLCQPAWEHLPCLSYAMALWVLVPTEEGMGILRIQRKEAGPDLRVLH